MKNPYVPIVLSLMPRVLTNLERDPSSPAYGSFDRNYWLLKIRPFSSAVLQQAVLMLAMCYQNRFEGNLYYKEPFIKQWAVASMNFWAKIQNSDGSFDEYWKGEGSFPATAFSTFSATEAYILLELDAPYLIKRMRCPVEFLSNKTEDFAVNQEVASIAAIYNMYMITKEKKFLVLSEKKIENLKGMQKTDGFFPEHGGADISYSMVALEYLSVIYEKTARSDVKSMCDKLIDFISYFVHPDGTIGGQYTSRNTGYFMPGALESCSYFNPSCSPMLRVLINNIVRSDYLNISFDERYLLHYVGPSYVRALLKYRDKETGKSLPFEQAVMRLFKDANIYIFSNLSAYLIISLLKGGIFRLYIDGKLIVSDTGYRILKGKKVYSAEIGDQVYYNLEGDKLEIVKNFFQKKYTFNSPFNSFLLFIYSLFLGNRFWNYFRRRFIKNAKKTNIFLKRKFVIDGNSLIIKDEIKNLPQAIVIKNPAELMQAIPSSKFFETQQLGKEALTFSFNARGNFCLTTVVDLKSGKIETEALDGILSKRNKT